MDGAYCQEACFFDALATNRGKGLNAGIFSANLSPQKYTVRNLSKNRCTNRYRLGILSKAPMSSTLVHERRCML